MNTAKQKPDFSQSQIITGIETSEDICDGSFVDQNKMVWVGIGASAGGLEALRALVSHLPKTANMTYIIAQHLSPHYKTALPQIIGRDSNLNVVEVIDGLIPQKDTIYVTPSGKDIEISEGRLRLKETQAGSCQPKPSIDRFLTSLANECRDRAVGIILSGTGADGAHGVKAIYANNGKVMVQSQATAKYFSMPYCALETGAVNFILSPEEIGQKLSEITDKSYVANESHDGEQEEDVDALEKLLVGLNRVTGVNFKDYKTNTVFRRIERRIRACHCDSLQEYVDFAFHNDEELMLLYKDMMISVTSFYRDPNAFDALQTQIKKIISQKKSGDCIRVWVAGCCTGEEVYSIAIELSESLRALKPNQNITFQVFATDINEDVLDKARFGAYDECSFQKMPSHLIDNYFQKTGSKYRVTKALRDKIVFSKHNVFQDPPFLRMDMVSCRNLMIYFNQVLQRKVFDLFYYSLIRHGLLFLGQSETINVNQDLFDVVNQKEKIFRRKIGRKTTSRAYIPAVSMLHGQKRIYGVTENQHTLDFQSEAVFKAMIGTFAPNSMIITQELDIKHIFGDIDHFISLEPGETKLNVFNLIKEKYRYQIPSLVRKAIQENKMVSGNEQNVIFNDQKKVLTISALPLQGPDTEEPVLLVIFSEQDCDDSADHFMGEENGEFITQKQNDFAVKEIARLERDLEETRIQLQTVVEELEMANEELQSLNEELQSTNEELETSNEELQSTNEELTTVNEELYIKTSELQLTNEDLDNVMESLDSPLMVVNKDLRVTRSNNAARKVLDISKSGHGEIITNIPSYFDLPTLRHDIQNVIQKNVFVHKSVQSNEKIYELSILPYKNKNGVIKGAVLIFIDQTELMEKERNLIHIKEFQRLVFDSIPDFIFVKDENFNLIEVNQSLLKQYGDMSKAEILGTTTADQYDSKEAREFLEQDKKALEDGYAETFENIHFPNGDEKTLHTVKVGFNANGSRYLLGVSRDMTEMIKIREQLKDLTYTNEAFISSGGDGYWDWDLETNYEYMTPRFWEILGYDHSKMEHHPKEWQRLIFEDDLKIALDNFAKHEQTKGEHPFEQEVRFKHADGSTVFVLCRGKIVEWGDDGKGKRMIGTHTDITPLKQTQEKLEQMNEELYEFAYRTSHDLRAPIASSIGLINFAKSALKDSPEKTEVALNHMNEMMEKLDKLIADIMSIVKSDYEIMKCTWIDLEALIDDILFITCMNPDQRIEIQKDINIKNVKSHKIKLHSILENLITNAIKYHDPDRKDPFIKISTKAVGNYIEISVRDNGLGIPQKYQEKLFGMFNRFHDDRSHGSGLGLYMVKKMTRQINGDIIFNSFDTGSEFIVKIPKEVL